MPWHRWLGNHLFSLLTRRAIGLDVQDSQCGYAAMKRRTQQALDWERLWKGYGYPNDLLSWLTVCGFCACVMFRYDRSMDPSRVGFDSVTSC
jgi:hypothetical protein